MTLDQPGPAAVRSGADPARSQAALERYRRRMRRGRTIYVAVIAVVVVVLGGVVALVWSHGEAAHTTLHTAAGPAPSIALGQPSAVLTPAWHSNDRTAIGTPYWGGTVVTYSHDSVRGRNGSTGAITWSYTRTDRTVCQAIQDQGVTVAVFELHGNCDQVTGLDSATGARKWTRTLDKDHQPLNGHPVYSITPFAVMFRTSTVIYTIDPSGGLDRWVYRPTDCLITGATIGAQGALISQVCAHPKCAGLTFCGPGPRLVLRDASAGRSDEDKDKANPDQIKWALSGTDAVPASADQLISAVDTHTGRLRVYAAAKGKTLADLDLHRGAGAPGPITAVATDRAELLWFAGTTYAVADADPAVLWTSPSVVAPTVTQPGRPSIPPVLTLSTVVAGGSSGVITLLKPDTGTARRTFPVAVPKGSRVYPFGTGFVVAAATTAVYR